MGTLNNRCPIIIGTPKGTIILTTTHMVQGSGLSCVFNIQGVWSSAMKPNLPRGSIYTTIMELGPKNHNGDGLLGPNSIMVVYMDPLG